MTTLSIHTLVRNAAAVFSGCLRRGHPPGPAGRLQPTDRLRPRPPDRATVATPDSASPPVEVPVRAGPSPRRSTRRRLAVTAFAMGISTRQIEDLLRVLLRRGWPRSLDHRPLGRRRREGRLVLKALDAGVRPRGRDARG